MKPSSVNIEKQPEDIIVVNMERPCSCEICALSADIERETNLEVEKDQADQKPTAEKRDD